MTNADTFRFPQRLAIATCLAILALVIGAGDCLANNEKPSSGSSSKKLKTEAIASIPFERLNPQGQAKISDVVSKASVYRRLPVTSINCDADYFKFLVRYPEVIVNIWRLMGVTKMTTERTGPYEIATNDGAGTISELELIYGTDNMHVFYGTGTYEGPVLKRKLNGKCVLVLRSNSGKDANGKSAVTSQLDVFLKIENATAGLIAKTISPIVGSTADHNFIESLKFVQRLNETTEKNGPGVQNMGKRLNLSQDVLIKFNDTIDVVFQRSMESAGVSMSQSRPANLPSDRTNAAARSTTQNPITRNPTRAAIQQQREAVFSSFNAAGNNAPASAPYRYSNGSYPSSGQYAPLPARGTQAPAYANPYQQRPQNYSRPPVYSGSTSQFQPATPPVQAYYYGQQGNGSQIQATGWRQR